MQILAIVVLVVFGLYAIVAAIAVILLGAGRVIEVLTENFFSALVTAGRVIHPADPKGFAEKWEDGLFTGVALFIVFIGTLALKGLLG